jgi:hypothetical protein
VRVCCCGVYNITHPARPQVLGALLESDFVSSIAIDNLLKQVQACVCVCSRVRVLDVCIYVFRCSHPSVVRPTTPPPRPPPQVPPPPCPARLCRGCWRCAARRVVPGLTQSLSPQVDAYHEVLLTRLCFLLRDHAEFAPHVVLPVRVAPELALARLKRRVLPAFRDSAARHPATRAKPLAKAGAGGVSQVAAEEFSSEALSPACLPDTRAEELDAEAELAKPLADSQTGASLAASLLAEAGFVLLPELESSADPRKFARSVGRSLDDWLQAQRCLFRTPEALSLGEARALTQHGLACLLPCGTHCPVCLVERGDTLDCTSESQGDPAEVSPVLWYSKCVFLCSPQHRSRFATDAVKFAGAAPPLPPVGRVIDVPVHLTAIAGRLVVRGVRPAQVRQDRACEAPGKSLWAGGRENILTNLI